MIKITAKKGKIKGELKGDAFEILNETIEITKAFYKDFNKHLPMLGDYYLHRINMELKGIENEEPTNFEKGLMEIIEDMRKVMAEEIEEEGEEENEEDHSVHPRHQRHRGN
jgi:hypothetical protein